MAKCPLCEKETFCYFTNWNKWRENRINEWTKDKDKKKLSDEEVKKQLKEYLSGGYVGETCHECNTSFYKNEIKLLDEATQNIEDIMNPSYNDNM